MLGASDQVTAHAAVARQLGRLDAYSFFVVPGQDWNADFAVVGTTGAFLVAVCDRAGVARVEARRPTVGGEAVPGLRKLRAGAKAFTARLGAASMFAEVVPIVCLTQAIAGPPNTRPPATLHNSVGVPPASFQMLSASAREET